MTPAPWRAPAMPAAMLAIALLAGGCSATREPLWSRLPDIVDEAAPPTPAAPPSAQARQDAGAAATAATATAAHTAPQPGGSAVRPALPALPAAFWPRLRARFAVPPLATADVASFRQAYGARPDFLMRTLQRGAPYLPGIAAQLEQAGLPADLALLPVIESAFDPRAVSPAAAAGIWQFIPETGRRYGLQRGWLRDDRRDAFSATTAAIAYLSDLYRQFGDWHLALAAYNCGEGCVARAASQAAAARQPRSFAGIAPWLPAETRAYVPRFIAVRDILANPAAFGVNLPSLDRAPRVVRFALGRDADLASVARLANMPLSDLADMNAGVLRQVVPAADAALWLTEAQGARLAAALAQPGVTLMRLKPVKANPSERLAALAARHGAGIEELRDINGIARSLNVIQSGTVFVPLKDGEAPVALQASAWPPLRMQGEESLVAGPSISRRDQDLMAAHPQWIESGWLPGRLQLPGRRRR